LGTGGKRRWTIGKESPRFHRGGGNQIAVGNSQDELVNIRKIEGGKINDD